MKYLVLIAIMTIVVFGSISCASTQESSKYINPTYEPYIEKDNVVGGYTITTYIKQE